MRRTLALLAAVCALAACNDPAPIDDADPTPPPQAVADASLPEGAVRPVFVRQYLDGSTPEWLQIMRQADGAFVHYSPATLYRYPAQNTAEVWLQLQHREPQRQAFESETAIETVEYERERYRYLLDCANRRFTILERTIVGPGGAAVRRTEMDDPANPRWRPILSGGPASILEGPLCNAT